MIAGIDTHGLARTLGRITLAGALLGATWGWWATRTTDEADRIKGWDD